MKKLNSLVEFPHVIDCYQFETPAECDAFVTEQRSKKLWAYKDGSRGQKPTECTFACVRIVGVADCADLYTVAA